MKVSKRLKKGLGVMASLVLLIATSLYAAMAVHAEESTPIAAGPGTQTIGATSYAIPEKALYVDPVKGSNANAGTLTAPFQTIQKAVDHAAAGQTIILRGGTYHQIGIAITKSNLTLQSYPGEAVWLDGSTVVTGWVQEGTRWVRSGWTAKFCSDPTDTWGAKDSDLPCWRFVKTEPAFQMAPHPDQVWINNVRQDQVKTLAEVSAGKFYVDYTSNKLYIGSNPAGAEVRASDLGSPLGAPVGGAPKGAAITVVAPNVTIRGIGVRCYATCVPDQGTIYANEGAKGLRLENVEIAHNATTGLSLFAVKNATLQNVSSHDNGLTGIGACYCDSLTLDQVSATRNNAESFNVAPVAAGIKILRSRDVTVSNSKISDNRAIGLWFDEDCYTMTVLSNEISNNKMTGHEENHTIQDPVTKKTYTCINETSGLMIEISGTAIVANNRITNNGTNGFLVLMSDNIQIYNNTITGGKYPLEVKNGSGRTRTWQAGLDKYSPGYPKLSWVVDTIKISNNIIGSAGSTLLLLKDDTGKRTGAMGVTLNGNVYYRPDTSSPGTLIRCLTQNYPTLAAFKTAAKQDSQSLELTGAAPLTTGNFATSDLQKKADTIAQPLPADIAAALKVDKNEKILGPIPTGTQSNPPEENPDGKPGAKPSGNLDRVESDKLSGWAWNPANPSSALTVKFRVFDSHNKDVTVSPITTTADMYRADVKNAGYGTGNYGFQQSMNWLKYAPGQYKVVAYAVTGSTEHELPNPRTFTVQPIRGNLDQVTQTYISAWAWKPDSPNSALSIKFNVYNSSNTLIHSVSVSANQHRADVKKAGFGTGNYGCTYTMDWSKYPAGTYRVEAYAVDGSSASPKLGEKTYKK
ncbi:MAG: right-handed parallel beta-helix repeat-containing protein [Peptococcaceae bacterium]|nr:right-handed parallel beta-helix repeat-containing protein [Peptococcaceae bacterium]